MLEEQDRSAWDRAAIEEGHRLVVDALRGGNAGRYALQAAIAALHAQAPSYEETDWPQILVLYDELLKVWTSPVVALNRAVVVAMVQGPEAALAEVEVLERRASLRLPLPVGDQSRHAASAWPPRRGGPRLPRRARPGGQRSRARVPCGPAGRIERQMISI